MAGKAKVENRKLITMGMIQKKKRKNISDREVIW
jgi:hypothetical protein